MKSNRELVKDAIVHTLKVRERDCLKTFETFIVSNRGQDYQKKVEVLLAKANTSFNERLSQTTSPIAIMDVSTLRNAKKGVIFTEDAIYATDNLLAESSISKTKIVPMYYKRINTWNKFSKYHEDLGIVLTYDLRQYDLYAGTYRDHLYDLIENVVTYTKPVLALERNKAIVLQEGTPLQKEAAMIYFEIMNQILRKTLPDYHSIQCDEDALYNAKMEVVEGEFKYEDDFDKDYIASAYHLLKEGFLFELYLCVDDDLLKKEMSIKVARDLIEELLKHKDNKEYMQIAILACMSIYSYMDLSILSDLVEILLIYTDFLDDNEKKEYMEIINNLYHGMRIHDDYDYNKNEGILNQIGEYFYNLAHLPEKKDDRSFYLKKALDNEYLDAYKAYALSNNYTGEVYANYLMERDVLSIKKGITPVNPQIKERILEIIAYFECPSEYINEKALYKDLELFKSINMGIYHKYLKYCIEHGVGCNYKKKEIVKNNKLFIDYYSAL